MALLEISVTPIGTSQTSMSQFVTDAIRLAEKEGFNYHISPTSTVFEGNVDELFELARDIHTQALKNGSERVVTNIKIEDREDKPLNIEGQVNEVQTALGS
ncbi:MTH1187 family thiamine-binding protein [Guptibacillus algicola]|uniref:MTH1187 family thiamine-binding protein n=1 Tax=Guptibacillus algicola TaxID=225844 RepID=UPI001CD2DA0B|nr:MTH1187 family thiamine-binding protein [Alkalihalobacillus algicola]MCA0988631.1 MTH1187 family thiamine-binding protein [Alkalihalobacillus algicola]